MALWWARLSPVDGAPVEVEPDRLPDTGNSVVGLLRQQIAMALIDESGALSLQFANGPLLHSKPDERLEAWTLTTAGGERMVCMPGAGVAYLPGAS